MGGPGSGTWYRWESKKATVEESAAVSIRDFRGRLHDGAAGTITWTWTDGKESSVGYSIFWDNGGLTITLQYCRPDIDNIRIPIRLQTMPTQFGGQRWWFTCPLTADGVVCNRRAGKLYLPPGAQYFGCRKCHDLTYRVCQDPLQAEGPLAAAEHRIERLHRRLVALNRRAGIA